MKYILYAIPRQENMNGWFAFHYHKLDVPADFCKNKLRQTTILIHHLKVKSIKDI